MAYNSMNLLKRMIDLQEAFKKEYRPGMSIEWIYRNVIYDRFKISRKTFYKWVNYPAANKLKELQDAKANNKIKAEQITMDFPERRDADNLRTGTHGGC